MSYVTSSFTYSLAAGSETKRAHVTRKSINKVQFKLTAHIELVRRVVGRLHIDGERAPAHTVLALEDQHL